MAKKKKAIDKRKKATKAGFSKMDKKLLDASEAILTVSIETGKKWHKFIKKTVTTVEPIREKQIDMFFDTTDAVITQVEEQAGKFRNRLGIQEDITDLVKKQLDRKKIINLLKSNASKLVSIANPDGIKKTIEAGAVKIKMEVEERFSPKKAKAVKKSKKKKSSKKKSAKKTGKVAKASKASKTKKTKVAAKPKAAKKKVAKTIAKKAAPKTRKTSVTKTRKPAAKKAAPKARVVKVTRASKPSASRKRTSTAKTTAAKKDDLTVVYGIGPKMAGILSKKGVTTFAALSKMPKTKLQGIIDDSGFAYKSYKANQWTQQATYASKGQFSQMNAWVDKNMK